MKKVRHREREPLQRNTDRHVDMRDVREALSNLAALVSPPIGNNQGLASLLRRLADAIAAAVSDREMQRRTNALGERIRSEDGVARAVEVIDHWQGGGG